EAATEASLLDSPECRSLDRKVKEPDAGSVHVGEREEDTGRRRRSAWAWPAFRRLEEPAGRESPPPTRRNNSCAARCGSPLSVRWPPAPAVPRFSAARECPESPCPRFPPAAAGSGPGVEREARWPLPLRA